MLPTINLYVNAAPVEASKRWPQRDKQKALFLDPRSLCEPLGGCLSTVRGLRLANFDLVNNFRSPLRLFSV